MALIHTIGGVTHYYTKWWVSYEIADTVSGQKYNFNPQFGHEVTGESPIVVAHINKTKTAIELEILLEANEMNFTQDVEDLIEHYQELKKDIILQIRANEEVALSAAAAYVAAQYPNSPFLFAQLYQIWLNRSGTTTWAEFKTFVISSRFKGIDDIGE